MIKNSVILIMISFLMGCSGSMHMQEGWSEATKSYHEASIINPNGQPVAVAALDGMKKNQVIDAYRAETGVMDAERVVQDMGSN